MVAFVSNDARCRALLKYIGGLFEGRRKAGQFVPVFVTVADFPKEEEPAFRAATGLEQTILYEKAGGETGTQYRAVPTPRVFSITKDLKVAAIHPSPAVAPFYQVGYSVRQGLWMRSASSSKVDERAPNPEELKAFDSPAETSPGDAKEGPARR
jgi:hypothetical protein